MASCLISILLVFGGVGNSRKRSRSCTPPISGKPENHRIDSKVSSLDGNPHDVGLWSSWKKICLSNGIFPQKRWRSQGGILPCDFEDSGKYIIPGSFAPQASQGSYLPLSFQQLFSLARPWKPGCARLVTRFSKSIILVSAGSSRKKKRNQGLHMHAHIKIYTPKNLYSPWNWTKSPWK